MTYKEGYEDAIDFAYGLLEDFLDTYAEDLDKEQRESLAEIQVQMINAKNA